MGPFAVSLERLRSLAANASGDLEQNLADGNLIAVSAVLVTDVKSPRFQAVLATLEASRIASVPHVVMLDSSSAPEATNLLRETKAIVVTIDHDTEGGLARPYVIAAQLVDAFAPPSAVMVKFEGEKPLFEGDRNVDSLYRAGQKFDIVTGERSKATWRSMPDYQWGTEFMLGYAIGKMLGISTDVASGVVVLSQMGRRLFIQKTEENSWTYLIWLPYEATVREMRVGTVEVGFTYHPAVVEEETDNPLFDEKRRKQLELMLNAAVAIGGGEQQLKHDGARALKTARTYLASIKQEAGIVDAKDSV